MLYTPNTKQIQKGWILKRHSKFPLDHAYVKKATTTYSPTTRKSNHFTDQFKSFFSKITKIYRYRHFTSIIDKEWQKLFQTWIYFTMQTWNDITNWLLKEHRKFLKSFDFIFPWHKLNSWYFKCLNSSIVVHLCFVLHPLLFPSKGE